VPVPQVPPYSNVQQAAIDVATKAQAAAKAAADAAAKREAERRARDAHIRAQHNKTSQGR
jgi:hypothetical protein